MAKRWQKSEITYLKRYGTSKSVEDLARRFRTDAAAVRAKLKELGLAPRGGEGESPIQADPGFKVFEEGLAALYKGQWEKARQLFQKAVAAAEAPELAGRARQLLAASERRLAEAAEAAGDDSTDPFLKAVFEKNRGNLDVAQEICNRGGRAKKDERFAYLLASILALEGRYDEASEALALAIEFNPENRIHAYYDPDFAQLRKRREFARLLDID